MRRFLYASAAVALVFVILSAIYYYTDLGNPFVHWGEPEVWASTENKEIVVLQDGEWKPFVFRGVNLGSGKPGAFTTDYAITYEEYMRWFSQIQEMNANVVRVYTILGPEFYHALYDFNTATDDPLYLVHGVWVDDYVLRNRNDAFDETLRDNFKEDCSKLVDVLHGRRSIFMNSRHGYGDYRWDVSPWLLGYILGVEWQQDLVLYTDHKRNDVAGYDGDYLYTAEDATPFESLLCEVGDHIISYETRKYGQQRLVAFSNWTETDPLDHDRFMYGQITDMVKVDAEHIKAHDAYRSGLFASYHVYPYYPEFMNFEQQFISYIDETGTVNPYRAYLKALNEHHEMPVVIAEFGIPTSRGISHEDSYRGYNQGNKNEREQGEALGVLYGDIIKAGCSGGMIFTWQDEWFKRTWNTMYAIDTTREPYWADIQTNEEFFGLLAFDPGEYETVSHVDGDTREWADVEPVSAGNGVSLSVLYDEAYMYFRVHLDEGTAEETPMYIALDVTPKSGSVADATHGYSFDRPMDFVLRIDGRDGTELFSQERYNALWANFRRDIYEQDAFLTPPAKDSPTFMEINLFLRDILGLLDEMFVPENEKENVILFNDLGVKDMVRLDALLFPTGELRYGNSNPNSAEFDSIADFMFAGSDVEVRIPWGLLNFQDASRMTIHDDYYTHYGVAGMDIDGIYACAGTEAGGSAPSGWVKLEGWDEEPTAHERLKRSYYMVKEMYRDHELAEEDE